MDRRRLLYGCGVCAVALVALIAVGVLVFERWGMLLPLCLTWGALALAWAAITTAAVVTQKESAAAEPMSVPVKLFLLVTAGLCLCIALPLLYDAFGNPLLPQRGPSGKWVLNHLSDELTVRLFILVPVPYAFFAFVVSERWHEWRARRRAFAS